MDDNLFTGEAFAKLSWTNKAELMHRFAQSVVDTCIARYGEPKSRLIINEMIEHTVQSFIDTYVKQYESDHKSRSVMREMVGWAVWHFIDKVQSGRIAGVVERAVGEWLNANVAASKKS